MDGLKREASSAEQAVFTALTKRKREREREGGDVAAFRTNSAKKRNAGGGSPPPPPSPPTPPPRGPFDPGN